MFGIAAATVASFEEPVKQISGKYGHIDLFWPGMLLVEHKSRGQDLGKAESQAFEYIQDLFARAGEDEVPRYVIVSDFARIALHDLEPEDRQPLPLFAGYRVDTIEFPLAELHRHIHDFAFIPGYQQHRFEDQDPINLRAVAIMDDLHDTLEAGGYSGHELERFLVRVLFCLFAEDTGIFEREAFRLYIEDRTKPDGSDLGPAPGAALRRAQHAAGEAAEEPRRNAGRVSLRQRRPFRRERWVSPTSTATCATACWPARGSTGRRFRPPFSARSFRASWSRASAGRSAATTPASATSSRWCGRCSSTTCGRSSSGSRATRTN